MRLAIVVASAYERSPALRSLRAAPEMARAVYDRLLVPDADFVVEWFEGHRDFPEELEGMLMELPTLPESVLLYFGGYLVWQVGRSPALGLDAPRPRAFPLSRLCGLLDRFSTEYRLVLDVALTEPGHPGAMVADAISDVVGEHAPSAGGLLGIGSVASMAESRSLTGIWLRSLSELEGRGLDVTLRAVHGQMGPELAWLEASEAVRLAEPGGDFVFLPGGALHSAPPPHEFVGLARQAARHRQVQDWPGLADVYQSMLDLGQASDGQELGRRLGALCRVELHDPWRAVHALEHVVVTHGSSAPLRFELSELCMATDQLDLAVEHCVEGLGLEPRDASAYRRARWLFERTGQTDRAWNAAAALSCLGVADEGEAEFANRHRPEGLMPATATLTEEHWNHALARPRRHPALEQVLQIVSAPAIQHRLQTLTKKKRLCVPDPNLRQDPKTSTTTLCRSLTWTARLLGVPAPELYVHASDEAEMRATPAPQPVTRVSKAFASGLTLPELAFLWGRHLTFFRPDHYLRVFYSTVDEMTSVLLGAMLAGEGDPERSRGHDPDTVRLGAHLRATLGQEELGVLRAATRKLTAANGRARVQGWVQSVARVANRAGLVACGDVHVAARMIQRFPIEAPEVDQVGDLTQYSLSDAYAELRRRLGVALP
jgi:hypothetical protein